MASRGNPSLENVRPCGTASTVPAVQAQQKAIWSGMRAATTCHAGEFDAGPSRPRGSELVVLGTQRSSRGTIAKHVERQAARQRRRCCALRPARNRFSSCSRGNNQFRIPGRRRIARAPNSSGVGLHRPSAGWRSGTARPPPAPAGRGRCRSSLGLYAPAVAGRWAAHVALDSPSWSGSPAQFGAGIAGRRSDDLIHLEDVAGWPQRRMWNS